MTSTTTGSTVTRMAANRSGGKMIADYWDNIFTAPERGKKVVWYNGSALNPIFQAAGLEWCHGEAFSARLAALHLEGPAQLAGAEYGYINELCSYSRTHLGCAVLSQGGGPAPGSETGAVDALDQAELAGRLPQPDFFVNAYSGCSTGQQWDEMSYRVFGKNVPIFNVSIPFLWGNHADSGYMQGQEWEEASDYVVAQLRELIAFIEGQTGRPFDWDALSESMSYIKRASELRLEGMELCTNKPTPATYWDWIASIAHINFLPGNQDLVNYFGSVRDEIAARVANGVPALENERYRLYFDGIMNWNKLGWLAKRFAEYDAAVIAGRYTHSSFWQEPQIIDAENPLRGMAQHYLICPINHSLKTLNYLTLRDCERFDIDGLVFHSTRTCRAFTNPQTLLARSAREHLGLPAMFFEGDVADASFYKDEVLESRLVAMLENIDVRRAKAGRW